MKNGCKIRDSLQSEWASNEMAEQIMEQIDIKSKEELLDEIQKSENPLYKDVYHVKSDREFAYNIDQKMTKREILESKLSGGICAENNVNRIDRGTITYTKIEEEKEVTPKDIAIVSQKNNITKSFFDKIKGLFNRILGREDKGKETVGKDIEEK